MLLTRFADSNALQIENATKILHRYGCEPILVNEEPGALFLTKIRNGSMERLRTELQQLPGVLHVIDIGGPYVLSSRDAREKRTQIRITDDVVIGGKEFVVMAGPCSVESLPQTMDIARSVKEAGASVLRGGAFKPRTSPFSFQGLREEGLEILKAVRGETGLPVISELLGQRKLEAVDDAVDIIQIGMRNSQNYMLLKEVGKLESRRPVLLKCGIGSSLDEFLCAADYILSGGNPNVILCLRGTIGFSQETRSSMNVADIPALRKRTHLPIVVDPSHVAGRWDLVPAISAAALVAGADGLLVEVHHSPEQALSDGEQSLKPERFHRMMHRLRLLAPIIGRKVAECSSPRFRDRGHPMRDFCMEDPPDTEAFDSLEETQNVIKGAHGVNP